MDVIVVVDSHTAEELDTVVELACCNSALGQLVLAGAVGQESWPVCLERHTCVFVVEDGQRMAPCCQGRAMAKGRVDGGFAEVET